MPRHIQAHIIFLFSLTVSISSVAAETRVGIGALIDSSPGFFIPIEMNGWLIEPSISAKKSKTDTINQVDNTRSKRDSRTAILGVGIFKNDPLVEKTYLYYGARLGLIIKKVKDNREASLILPAISSVTDEDGFFIAPTIGVQYFFIPQFSVGIDMTFQYTRTDGEETATSNGITVVVDAESSSFATTASVIVRYMF